MSKPFVSILIPAYNAEKWLADAIRSAIAQTWNEKEIIVVDDGSTDGTLGVARQFEDDTVRVISQRNQGAAAARNKALSLSRGDYIQWLDADDILARDKISLQMKCLEQCRSAKVLVSSAWGTFMYRFERARFVPTSLWRDLSPVEWLLRKMNDNIYMQTATWLVDRELTEAAGPWNTKLLGDDDGEYFCRVMLNCSAIRFVPEARVYYRAVGDSSLSYIGVSDRKIEAHWRSMQLHIAYLRSLEDSPRSRAACVNYLQDSLMFFHPERPDLVSQATALAAELGGQLREPQLSWKYAWIDMMFGRVLAKRARFILPAIKWSVVRAWDRALSRMENRQQAPV